MTLAAARTPARPGPGPISDELLRTLELGVRRRVDALLAGEHRSATLGLGSELAQVRPYVPGDDVRLIDWNVTARTGEPHVREQVAERVLTTWLAVDTSLSMTFGTADRRKADVAEGVAHSIGYVASRHGNRLGVVTYGDSSPRTLRPRQGRAGLLALLLALRAEPDETAVGPTALAAALARVRRVARRPSLVVLVGDFRGPLDWRSELVALAARNHVVAVEIRDPREQELVRVGDLWLVDPETGRQLRVDTSSRRIRERFAASAVEERAQVAATLASAGADHTVVTTSGSWLRELAAFLRRLETRR